MKKIPFVLLFFIFSKFGFCQQTDLFNTTILENLNEEKKMYIKIDRGNFLLNFYKNYISSQDGSGCTFIPSCSLYAKHCIEKKGIFFGILASFDRVARCNGHNHNFYIFDYHFHKVIDKVE